MSIKALPLFFGLLLLPSISFCQDTSSIFKQFAKEGKLDKNNSDFIPDYLLFLQWNSKGKSVYHRNYDLAEEVQKRINHKFKDSIEGDCKNSLVADNVQNCLQKRDSPSDFKMSDELDARIKKVIYLLGTPDGMYINIFAHIGRPSQNVITLVYGFECYDEFPVKDLGNCQSYLYVNVLSQSCVIDVMIVMQ